MPFFDPFSVNLSVYLLVRFAVFKGIAGQLRLVRQTTVWRTGKKQKFNDAALRLTVSGNSESGLYTGRKNSLCLLDTFQQLLNN